MRLLIIIALLLLINQKNYAQNKPDTVKIKTFELVENKLPLSYKSEKFDSTSINNAENLAQLIGNNSTVFIKTYGAGSLASISLRGTGASHTKVLWNGVALNSPMNGQIDFSLFPTFFFDEAEIHYGAGGLIDGNGALGGSILLNNKDNKYNKGLGLELKQSLGSYKNYITAGKLNYSNKSWSSAAKFYRYTNANNFKYTNITKAEQPTEYLSNAQVKQYGFQYAINKKFKYNKLTARIWYFNSDRNLPSSLLTSNNHERQLDESLRTLIQLKGMAKNFQYQLISALIKEQLIYQNNTLKINAKNNSYLIDNRANTKYYLNNKFTLINDVDIKYESAIADGYDAAHKRFNNSWLTGLNINFNRINFSILNRFLAVNNFNKMLAPSVGSQLKILKKEKLFLKANVGINYNYPTFNDLYWNPGGNINLKPEEAKMSELSLSYQNKSNKIKLFTTITGFYGIIKDWIIWQPSTFNYWQPSNIKKVENKGIEASLKILKTINTIKIQSKISYAFTQSTNKEVAQNAVDFSINKQLIYVPFNKLNYSLLVFYNNFYLNYTYNFTSKRFISTDNNWYLPANFISDLSLSKKIKLKAKRILNFTFSVYNLFNQAYQSIAYRPMPKRNYLITISYKFNE